VVAVAVVVAVVVAVASSLRCIYYLDYFVRPSVRCCPPVRPSVRHQKMIIFDFVTK
jgi:hypothetical protein